MAQRNLIFTPEGWEEYQYWLKQDRKTTNKINQLINDARRNPFDGLGKPEPLKENYTGLWSRRIDDKNRLIYAVTDEEIRIVGCRFHY
jgi:toxin YoeB